MSEGERYRRGVMPGRFQPLHYGHLYVIAWSQRVDVIPVMDINSNKQWVKYLEMLLPSFDVGISGNPLVQLLFLDAGYKVLKPPLYRREECSGTVIRRKIIEGKEWRDCVPEETVEMLEKFGFEERLRHLAGGE